ncbi:zinc ribbon domain-containing protein [Actinoallomurus sp. CA-142502]|uniref:zinc ribbon domain-containing protein n=1 Tax=Actinoallomurus sp. CA-142502 TaxID=3239885 RepID=UPI003D8E938C
MADVGMGEVRRQLIYKTTWNGGRLVVADHWFPSSKTCSGCGETENAPGRPGGTAVPVEPV